MIRFIPYRWQGKEYKTINGLFRAVVKRHPGYSMSFDINTMYVRNRNQNIIKYSVSRSDEANIISNEPTGE